MAGQDELVHAPYVSGGVEYNAEFDRYYFYLRVAANNKIHTGMVEMDPKTNRVSPTKLSEMLQGLADLVIEQK